MEVHGIAPVWERELTQFSSWQHSLAGTTQVCRCPAGLWVGPCGSLIVIELQTTQETFKNVSFFILLVFPGRPSNILRT